MGVDQETRREVRARAAADLHAARYLRGSVAPEQWDVPTLYPSWQQGGFRECIRPTCTRIRDIGDRTGYCPPHSARYRRPDPTIEQVQQHIDGLLAAGATTGSIAAAAGVARSTIRAITLAGPDSLTGTSVRWRVVGIDPAAALTKVPRWRINRRLRSMIAAGVGMGELVQMTGLNDSTLRTYIAEPNPGFVTRRAGDRIFAAWHEVESRPVRPLDRHLDPWMVQREWPVPAEWDDIDAPDNDPTPNVWITPETRLPSLHVLQRVAEHHGVFLAARFTGSPKGWLETVLDPRRDEPIRSRDYDLALSGTRAEYERLMGRRKRDRMLAAGGESRAVGDAATVPVSAA